MIDKKVPRRVALLSLLGLGSLAEAKEQGEEKKQVRGEVIGALESSWPVYDILVEEKRGNEGHQYSRYGRYLVATTDRGMEHLKENIKKGTQVTVDESKALSIPTIHPVEVCGYGELKIIRIQNIKKTKD